MEGGFAAWLPCGMNDADEPHFNKTFETFCHLVNWELWFGLKLSTSVG